MWKDTLLQGFTALLPVFLFLVWYDRPERRRYAPLFVGVLSGLAIVLNKQFPIVLTEGLQVDFSIVPLLVGALYGGLPVAVSLCALYGIVRFSQISAPWEFVYIAVFLAVLLPPLFRFSSTYLLGSWSRRIKNLLMLLGILSAFLISTLVIHYSGQSPWITQQDLPSLLLYGAVFMFALAAAVNFMEMGFERVRLQEELRDMSKKYRGEMHRLQQLIDQAPLAVVFLDSTGRITHINDSCLSLLYPLNRSDVVNQHYGPLAQVFSSKMTSPFDRVMNGEERIVETIPFRGKTFYTVTCVIQGMQGPTSDGILFIGHDVTDLLQLKDAVGRMERLSLVGQMAASITHEIRNPMAVIRGFVQLLYERSSSEQQSYFQIVMEELDRANAIINDFLSLAQNRIVEKQPGSLHDVLSELMPLISADANMRGQIVELRFCEEIEPLEINSKEIKQLVLNLARNGMEAMGDNGVLKLETVNLADTIQLRVTDGGVGISQEKLERLFEPFYTTKANGTGLGLLLCLSIVERHNGKIDVESKVGEGTTFIVSFCKPGRRCW